jgi:hypothetical protein
MHHVITTFRSPRQSGQQRLQMPSYHILVCLISLMIIIPSMIGVRGDYASDCWTQAEPIGDCYGWGQCHLNIANGTFGGPAWRCTCSVRRYELDSSVSLDPKLAHPSCRFNCKFVPLS